MIFKKTTKLKPIDVTWDQVTEWISGDSLAGKTPRVFGDFELIDKLGDSSPEREITLVTAQEGSYPQHVHQNSDAVFFITEGKATFLSSDERKEVLPGQKICVPRGMPHGFDIPKGQRLVFVSIQSPPIRNPDSGEEDFELHKMV